MENLTTIQEKEVPKKSQWQKNFNDVFNLDLESNQK